LQPKPWRAFEWDFEVSDFLLPEILVNKAREVVDANRTAGR
jgi:hypothetical protein